MSETTPVKKNLPRAFENLIKEKLESNGKGRKHLIAQLGSKEKVLELLNDIWRNRLSPKEIQRKYNVGYYQVYRFVKQVEPYKDAIIQYIDFDETVRDFRSFPIVQKWEAKIRRSGHLSQLSLIPTMANICGYRYHVSQKPYVKGFKCSPEKFDLEKAQKFVDLYLKQHKDKKKLPINLRRAIRHFLMVAKEINIPRGMGDIYGLSGHKDNYGKYRFVKLNDEQIEKVREFLKDDLEALTFFDWGIESLARATPLCLTKMNFIEKGNIVTTTIFETKTAGKGRGGVFQKFLLLNIKHCRETWEEIKKLGKGRTFLFFDKEPNKKEIKYFQSVMSKKLKEAYKKAEVTEPYAYRKSLHFLRHTGAHLWLMRSYYDYGLVAELGWDDINTLRDCYGGLPPEILKDKISNLSNLSMNGGI